MPEISLTHDVNMKEAFLQRLTEIIEQNLTNERFSVEDLAREMGMSYTKLYRLLKSTTQQTISQFIRQVRLKKANEMLVNEDITASEVAYKVGFGSPTYFNKCFHDFYGYAPGEFRKRELNNEKKLQKLRIINQSIRRNLVFILILILLLIVSALFYINMLTVDFPNQHTVKKYQPKFDYRIRFSMTAFL